MMRGRVASTRRRQAHSTTCAPQKLATKVDNTEKQHRQHKKSVQRSSDIPNQFSKSPLRKCNSDSLFECDKALKKLNKVSSLLERSATLEKDFEENLHSIQQKFKTELNLKSENGS